MGLKLSYSAVNAYKQCPQKYYHSRKWRSKEKPSAFAFGIAIENAITHMLVAEDLEQALTCFNTEWEDHKDVPDLEYYKSDFDKALVSSDDEFIKESFEKLVDDHEEYDGWFDAFEYEFSEADLEHQENLDRAVQLLKFQKRVYWWSCRLRAKYMLTSFWEEVYPLIEEVIPIKGKAATQYKIQLKNDKGDELLGFIDYIIQFKDRKKASVTDAKTAANPYSEHDINTSDQLRTYVTAMRTRHNMDLEACYMVLLKKLKKAKVCEECNLDFDSRKRKCEKCKEDLTTTFRAETQLLFTDYTDELLEQELDDYENIVHAIDNGINFRNTGNCMAYGRPCEFYDLCWNNKKPEEVEHLIPRKERK